MSGAGWKSATVVLGLAAALSLVAPGCSVEIPESATFSCNTDEDCGGDGYKCALAPGKKLGYCCFPQTEVCDKKDNDCNGVVDDNVTPACK